MSTIVQDTATEASTTALESHTPETGGPVSKHPIFTGTLNVDGASDSIRHSGTVSAVYIYAATPGSADYKFALDWPCKTHAAGDQPCFYVRLDPTAHTGIRLLHDITNNQWTLSKIIVGAVTSLGTKTQTVAAATTYHVTGDVVGTTVRVWIDTPETDPPTLTGSTGTVTAAGKVGVGNKGSVSTTATTGLHIDNLLIETVSIPSAPVNTAPPTITPASPPYLVDDIISVTAGTYTGSGISLSYAWQRCALNGTGCSTVGTGSTYAIVAADLGHMIKVVETATNLGGSASASASILLDPAIDSGWQVGTMYVFTVDGWVPGTLFSYVTG